MYNIRLIEQNDFKRLFAKKQGTGLPNGFTETTESTTMPSNTYAWNTNYQALHVNDSSNSVKGSLDIELGGLSIGDVVEVFCEVMNISGTNAKLYLDRTEPTSIGGVFAYQSTKNGEFETISAKIVVPYKGRYKLVIGTFTSDIGEYYVRNINISIPRKINMNWYPSIRAYLYKKISGTWTLQSNHTPNSATISVTSDYIQITHGIPFSIAPSGNIGVAFAQIYGIDEKYICKVSGATVDGVRVSFYDIVTGDIVDPSNVDDDISFNVIHHGYESERYIGV